MDDGGRCQLVDVINDPHLLESFLENGAANSADRSSNNKNNSSHKQSPSKQSQSAVKVTKKSAKPQTRVKVTSSPAEGKNNKKKVEARQVDTVTSSDGSALVAESSEEKKNSKSGSKSASVHKSSLVPTTRPAGGLMIPQQLQVQVAPGTQVVPGINGPMLVARPAAQTTSGPLVQIIQTSNGPTAQYIPVSMQSNQAVNKSSGGQGTRAGNKQILPKPSVSTASSSISTLAPNNPVIRPALSVAGTPHAVTLSQNGLNAGGTQLILSGGQTPSLIQGPNGTFILNPAALQGMGGQQLFLQNNGLAGSPIQLTIRAPGPQVVVSSSPSFQSSPSLLNVLSQPNRGVTGQPTFVLQQNAGQSVFAPRSSAQNVVWTRNSSPVISSPALIQNPAPQPQQYISIQTANGPVLLPLAMGQSGPQIMPQSSQSISIPGNNHNPLVQNFGGQFSGTTLQSLLTANSTANDLSHVSVSSANNSIIITTSQSTSQTTSTTPRNSHKKNNSAKSVNLADLLKESGILENSPPTSPTDTKSNAANASGNDSTSIVHQQQQQQPQQPSPAQQQTVFMVPAGANQPAQNLVLTQGGIQTPGINQLRLALTADGSMILQPSMSGVQTFSVQQPMQQFVETPVLAPKELVKETGLTASQPSPDSTTPTLDATPQSVPATADQSPVTNTASDSKSKEMPEDESKASVIPMTVADINSTNESQKAARLGLEEGSQGEEGSTTSSPVTRLANCDSRTQGTGPTSGTEPLNRRTDGTAGAVMQISLDDKAFMDGLEAQIRGLSAITSATEQQKSQLRELQDLQKQINEAKKRKNQMPGNESVKVLLGAPTRVTAPEQQQTQPVYQTTHVIQTNTQSVGQQQANVQLVNILKPQGTGLTVTPQTSIRLMPPSVATSDTPTFQLMGNQLITITSPAKSPAQSSVQSQVPASVSNVCYFLLCILSDCVALSAAKDFSPRDSRDTSGEDTDDTVRSSTHSPGA